MLRRLAFMGEYAKSENQTADLDPAEHLPYLLLKLTAALQAPFGALIGAHGLTQPQWRSLLALWKKPSQSIGDLSNYAGIEISTLSRTIAGLVERGLVERCRLEADARTVIVNLTPAGSDLTRSLIPAAIEIERRMLAGLTPQDERALRSALDTMLHNVHQIDWMTRAESVSV
jgi:DNA-binding MarR family transcriptional regulator